MNQTKITSCRYIDVVQSPTFAEAYIFHFLFYFIFTASTTEHNGGPYFSVSREENSPLDDLHAVVAPGHRRLGRGK